MWPTIHSFWKRSITVLSYPLTYLMAFKLEVATHIQTWPDRRNFDGSVHILKLWTRLQAKKLIRSYPGLVVSSSHQVHMKMNVWERGCNLSNTGIGLQHLWRGHAWGTTCFTTTIVKTIRIIWNMARYYYYCLTKGLFARYQHIQMMQKWTKCKLNKLEE